LTSLEAAYARAAAAAPAVVAAIGTALNAFWGFLKDIGSNLIGATLADWIKSLNPSTQQEVVGTNEMLTENGFPRTNNAKIYNIGSMYSYVFTDQYNADVCAPIYQINRQGSAQVYNPFIPMLEGPEAIGMQQAAKALTQKKIAAAKKLRMLAPYESVNYPMPPATRLNVPTGEPAVFTTQEGFCGVDYQCDNSLKQGVVRVISLNPYLRTTYEGAFAIDYSSVNRYLSA
jgi:hypothetical protein